MTKKSIGFIIFIGILCVGGIILFLNSKKTATATTPTSMDQKKMVTPAISPQPTLQITPQFTSTPTSSSKYSASIRAKVRAEFIKNCTNHYGQKYASACNCGADYLAANYSDDDLAKVYVEYHTTGKVTPEIQKAIDACQDK